MTVKTDKIHFAATSVIPVKEKDVPLHTSQSFTTRDMLLIYPFPDDEPLSLQGYKREVRATIIIRDIYFDPKSQQHLPLSYEIQGIDENAYILKVEHKGSGLVLMPTYHELVNAESPCKIYIKGDQSNTIVGFGTIETNQMDRSDAIKRKQKLFFLQHGVPANVYTNPNFSKVPFFDSIASSLLFLLVVTLVLVFLILLVWVIVKSVHERHHQAVKG